MPGREALVARLLSTIPKECDTIIIGGEDLLLAAKRNRGARQAIGDYLLFIDDDNYLRADAIANMVKHFDYGIGVMGVVAFYDDPDLKHMVADGGSLRNYTTGFTKGLLTNNWSDELPDEIYDVDEVANAFMVRRDLFERIGGLDEENFPIDLDEADLCKRIKKMGYRIVYNPFAICYHKSITYSWVPDFRRPLNAYFMGRNRQLYQRKHLTALPYCMYLIFFLPVFVGFYTVSLVGRKKFSLIPYFLKGVFDGLLNRRENQFQQGKRS